MRGIYGPSNKNLVIIGYEIRRNEEESPKITNDNVNKIFGTFFMMSILFDRE